jgi:hypothetical protein
MDISVYLRMAEQDTLELDEDARKIASASCGIDVRPGELPGDTGHEADPFDPIAALDVIGHIGAGAVAPRHVSPPFGVSSRCIARRR